MPKCYIRNGVWGWPVERQEKALGDALDREVLYQDTLPNDRAKAPGRVKAEWLTQRAQMLRPSGRQQDEIHVATLLALAVTQEDLGAVLVAASGRKTTIVVHDCGMSIPPGGDMAVLYTAMTTWQAARALSRSIPGRLEGVRVAAEKKRARTMRQVKLARPLWRDAKAGRLTTDQIAEQVSLSAKTLYSELGRRPAIRKGRPV